MRVPPREGRSLRPRLGPCQVEWPWAGAGPQGVDVMERIKSRTRTQGRRYGSRFTGHLWFPGTMGYARALVRPAHSPHHQRPACVQQPAIAKHASVSTPATSISQIDNHDCVIPFPGTGSLGPWRRGPHSRVRTGTPSPLFSYRIPDACHTLCVYLPMASLGAASLILAEKAAA